MQWLKQSTAVTLKIGPFVDETDGKTAEAGLTIAQADVRLSMNGGNMAQKTEASACTHDEIGVYDCPVDGTDTGTLGRLQLFVHESGALPVWHEFMVVPANVWDSFFGADYLQIDVEQLDGDATAAANLNSACDNYSATRGLSGTALPAAAADAAGGLPISDAGGLDLDTQIGTDIDAILAGTVLLSTTIGSNNRGKTSCELAAGSDNNDAYIGCLVILDDDAGDFEFVSRTITDYVGASKTVTWSPAITEDANDGGNIYIVPGDTKINVTADAIKAKTDNLPADPADDSDIDAQLATIVADTNELQTDWTDGGRLDLILDAASAPSAAAVADAVWDELSTGHVSAGKAGAQLWTDVDAILADSNELQTDWADGGRLDLILDAASAPSAAAVADAVWDELSTGHVSAGKAGAQLWTDIDAILANMTTAGAGAITVTYTVTSSVDSSPIPDVTVWVTSDEAGTQLLASGITDANGVVTFYLDAGTIYLWSQKSGWDFSNPDTETVS